MRYRTRLGKPIGDVGDQNLISGATSGVANIFKSQGALGRIIVGFFSYLVKVGSFMTRSVLRVKLGERTFGALTVISVFVFIWFVKYYKQVMEAMNFQTESFIEKVGYFFIEIFLAIPMMILSGLFGPSEAPDATNSGFFNSSLVNISVDLGMESLIFGLIILILGITHFLDIYSRKKRKEIIHSYYRGDSLLFGWLEGRVIFENKIKNVFIWMIIEPLFVIMVAWLISIFLGWSEVAFLLYISGVCMFIEEYSVYVENRQFLLDMMDNQLDANYATNLQKELAEWNDSSETQVTKHKAMLAGSGSKRSVKRNLSPKRDTYFKAKIN